MMPDLGEIIGQKQRQLAMAAEKAARLNDVLSRPDEDFIVYRRSGARGLGSFQGLSGNGMFFVVSRPSNGKPRRDHSPNFNLCAPG